MTHRNFPGNVDLFDDYDRKGPKIFLGEYAVNGGNTIASMECALAEASFAAWGREKSGYCQADRLCSAVPELGLHSLEA